MLELRADGKEFKEIIKKSVDALNVYSLKEDRYGVILVTEY
jgi:hypothetical protein